MPQENAVPAAATKSDHCLRAPAATVELREPASPRLLPRARAGSGSRLCGRPTG